MIQTFSRLGWCVAILLGRFASIIQADESALLHSEFIYESGPYPQIHATTLAETPTGLVAAWFGGKHERNPDVGIWVSRHIDGQWTESVEVANGVQHKFPDGGEHRHPTWNPVLFQAPQGPLLLFYKVGPSPQVWWGMLTLSRDGGQTWETPRRLPEGILGPIKNKPLLLADGTLLCASSEEGVDASGRPRWTIHFERTCDWGKTWERTPPLHNGVDIQAIQPSLLVLGEGKLLAVGRTRQQRLFEIRGHDRGQDWDEIALGGLPNNNSGLDAVTLSDGTHLLVYNHIQPADGTGPDLPRAAANARTPLNLAASADGTDWQAALVLEDSPGEYSYPAIIQTSDGRAHITYTWNRRRVKHVVIDPTKLERKPIVDGRWPD